MNLYKIYIILAAVFTVFAAAVLAVDPSYADFLFKEDGIIELTQVAIAGLSMVLAAILAVRGYIRKDVWKFWAGLSAISFLYIGESLSWGERIFNLKMPRIAGVTFDALHDLLAVSIGIIKKTRDFILEIGIQDLRSIAIIASSIIALSALLYFLIKIITKRREEISRFFKANLKKAPFLFLFIALVLIIVAMIVDEDNLIGFPHKEVVDEGLELLAVLGFLLSCICGFVGRKWGFAKKDDL